MTRIQLSKNFYLDEFTRSEIAIRHDLDIVVDPNSTVFKNLQALCQHVLQPLRDALGPVHILSGYRPTQINQLVGGSKNSQHCKGQAADIVVTGHSPLEVCRWIADRQCYDQLIHEFGRWTHVSLTRNKQRRQRLTALHSKGRVVYKTGLLEVE